MRQLLEVCEAELKPADARIGSTRSVAARSFAQHAEQARRLCSNLRRHVGVVMREQLGREGARDQRLAHARALDCTTSDRLEQPEALEHIRRRAVEAAVGRERPASP